MSDNEGCQDINYNEESNVSELSTTSNRSVMSTPRHVETGSRNGAIENIEQRDCAPPPSYEESLKMEQRNTSNDRTRGQSGIADHSVEFVTIDENMTQCHLINAPPCETSPAVFTNDNVHPFQNNDIPMQCLECLESELNSQQNQVEHDTSKNSRNAILTVFFVLLAFLCYINIYLFMFILATIVVVIIANLGSQDEQFEE